MHASLTTSRYIISMFRFLWKNMTWSRWRRLRRHQSVSDVGRMNACIMTGVKLRFDKHTQKNQHLDLLLLA